MFNGEIYGYRDLRAALAKRGHVFRTDSDTEVVLNAYLEWGDDFVTHVDGKPVEREDEISRAAPKKHAGESIELTIKRGGRSSKVRVVLAPLDDSSV